MPIEKASTVHNTILSTVERPMVFNVGAGGTALNEVPLTTTGTDGDEYLGDVVVMITDSSAAAGAADVQVECFDYTALDATVDDDNAADAGTAVTAADAADTVGEGVEDLLEDGDNCEVITADVAANTEAIIIIQIESIN